MYCANVPIKHTIPFLPFSLKYSELKKMCARERAKTCEVFRSVDISGLARDKICHTEINIK